MSSPWPGKSNGNASYVHLSGHKDWTQLSIEELMNVQVVTLTKQEQRLADTASAIFVITRDDICRSGVTNIPDAPRLAPGVRLARIDAASAITNKACRE
jgi:iron complex outermembrane receptor protein